MKGAKSEEKADNKLSVKKAATGSKPAVKRFKRKDTRPFFVFMEEFKNEYQEKHPENKRISVIAKAGGDKWRELSDAERAPFVAKGEKRKAKYEKKLEVYKSKQAEGTEVEEDESDDDDEGSDDEDDDDQGSDDDDDEGSDDDDDDEGSGDDEDDDDDDDGNDGNDTFSSQPIGHLHV